MFAGQENKWCKPGYGDCTKKSLSIAIDLRVVDEAYSFETAEKTNASSFQGVDTKLIDSSLMRDCISSRGPSRCAA